MNEKKTENELSQWFSTYGVITAERVLGTYQIVLQQSELLDAVKSPFSFYHHLLKVPLKNVLNGIILQQANDYHVYAQKLFIDYLLSGESGKPPEAQGAQTRESMEEERQELVTLGEEFHQLQNSHDSLIASSQAALIKIAKEWKVIMESGIKYTHSTLKNNNIEIKKTKVRSGINHALIHCPLNNASSTENKHLFIDKMNEKLQFQLTEQLKEQLNDNLIDLINFTIQLHTKIESFLERVEGIAHQALSYRTQFYNSILRATELIQLLPEYKMDLAQDQINKESLFFDKSIGENLAK